MRQEVERELRKASLNELLGCADRWLRTNHSVIRMLANLCRRVESADNPYDKLGTELGNRRVKRILGNLQPSYLAELMQAGLDGGAQTEFLELIIALD